MPIYDYKCPDGHITTRLVRWSQKPDTVPCKTCGKGAKWQFPAVHVPPDGVYSYEPNLGDPDQFDRRQEEIRASKEDAA